MASTGQHTHTHSQRWLLSHTSIRALRSHQHGMDLDVGELRCTTCCSMVNVLHACTCQPACMYMLPLVFNLQVLTDLQVV
jgi:hypothetical protein